MGDILEQTGNDFDWQLAEQILEELMTSAETRRKKKMLGLSKRSGLTAGFAKNL